MHFSRGLLFIILAFLPITPAIVRAQTTLVDRLGAWSYRVDGVNLGTAWRARNYADSAWPVSFAPLGYGDAVQNLPVPPGNAATTYFRRHFNVVNPTGYSSVRLRIRRDDGAVVWLNGAPV